MSIYSKLNESDAPEYYDEEAGIHYLFPGIKSISKTSKLSLIAKHGVPRRTERTIKTEIATIEGLTPEFETQMIFPTHDDE